jgi:integrase
LLGVHTKAVQERLRHTDFAMMNLYLHVIADMQRQAADQLDAVIIGAPKTA